MTTDARDFPQAARAALHDVRLQGALAHLKEAVRFEDRNAESWGYLAIAYGRDKNMGMMALASAEQGIASGDLDFARQQAARAIKLLPPGPAKQRAIDLQGEAKRGSH